MKIPQTNRDGAPRKIGVEIEYSNLSLEPSARIIRELFGGAAVRNNRFSWRVEETRLGDFALEMDMRLLSKMSRTEGPGKFLGSLLGEESMEELEQMAEEMASFLVPYEVACPPLPLADLGEIDALVDAFRQEGALGTTSMIRYAFGVHLNVEPPATDVSTLLAYFRAFLLLRRWLEHQTEVDMTRQLSPFIDDFPSRYVRKVLAPEYAPEQNAFIADYLEANPSRNRMLDLLPLLAYLDEKAVRKALPDEKISPRPAFHYRLPNSKVDLLRWDVSQEWKIWTAVEVLAAEEEERNRLAEIYRKEQEKTLPDNDRWLRELNRSVNRLL